jgi:hypothetical protein
MRIPTRRLVALVAAAALTGAALGAAAPAGGVITYTDAAPQPGVADLSDETRESAMAQIECPAPGECVAVGIFGSSGKVAAWGATMTGGVWADAVELPGVATLDVAGQVQLNALSCPAVGECVAGGTVRSDPGPLSGYDAFVIIMTGGAWQTAELVDGVAVGVYAYVTDISCGAPGNCAVTGLADNAFVADIVGGVLGDAVRIPGLDPTEGDFPLVSCASVDFCVLVGTYFEVGASAATYFSATRTAGTWADAVPIPYATGLDVSWGDYPTGLECPAVGHCTMVAIVETGGPSDAVEPAFAAEMVGGTFGAITQLDVDPTLATSPFLEPSRLACPAPGECVIGGIYYTDTWAPGLFTVVQRGGVWGPATPMAGITPGSIPGVEPLVFSVACAAVGACAMVGQMLPGSPESTGFLLTVDAGEVGAPEVIPGLATLQDGTRAAGTAVACTSDGACVGGGGYRVTGSSWTRAFEFSVAGLEPTPTPPTPDPGPDPDPDPAPRFVG